MRDEIEMKESSLFKDRAYDINLEVKQELQFSDKYSFTQHVSELSRKTIFGFFKLVAGESLKENYTNDLDDEFGNIVNVLFQRFKLESLDDSGSLESSIGEYIRNLEEYLFYIPESLLGDNKYNITPSDIGFYHCNLETLAKLFIDMLKLLRIEKITFWKRLFEEYKKDREGYDLSFRKKATRQKKDLDRASKITINDIEDFTNRVKRKQEKN